MARPKLLRRIGKKPSATYYKPRGILMRELEEVVISVDCLEALRLVDCNGLDQEKAAVSMQVSKATLCRILAEGRRVVATAITQGQALRIEGGDYFFDCPEEGFRGSE